MKHKSIRHLFGVVVLGLFINACCGVCDDPTALIFKRKESDAKTSSEETENEEEREAERRREKRREEEEDRRREEEDRRREEEDLRREAEEERQREEDRRRREEEKRRPRRVELVVTVRVDQTKSNGSAWDVGGGAPDVQVIARSDADGTVLRGQKHQDTFSFTENLGEMTLTYGDKITLTFVDVDAVENDPMETISVTFNESGKSVGKIGTVQSTISYRESN